MESIVNVEDRLSLIKFLFELMDEAKVFTADIYFDTTYQKWDIASNFRVECLSLAISDPRHKKTINTIKKLTEDIISLSKKIESHRVVNDVFHYRFTCKTAGNKLIEYKLIKKKFDFEKEADDEFEYIDGQWFPYNENPYKNNRSIQNRIFSWSFLLSDFAFEINQFIIDRILLDGVNTKTESNHIQHQSVATSKQYETQNLVFESLSRMQPYERMQYYLYTIQPYILKDNILDNNQLTNEGAAKMQIKNAAEIFQCNIDEIENTRYGLMPKSLYPSLFEPFDLEYNRALCERQAVTLFELKKVEIEKEVEKYERSGLSPLGYYSKVLEEKTKLWSRHIDEPGRLNFIKKCFDEYLKPYLEQKLNIKPEMLNETTDQIKKVDFKLLLLRIRFDKDEETKKKVEGCLLQLSNSECFTKANAKEFTAVALIFFQTGWIINTKTFSEWLSVFSKAFAREKSTYKMNQVETSSEAMKRKIPFLDRLPKKQKIQSF